MTFRRTTALMLVAASLTLGGCPKKTKTVSLSEDDAADPTRNFSAGIESLVPDRKGEVNYVAAYDFFDKAATLSNSKKAHFNAGWTAEEMGDLAKAEMHYRKAYESDMAYEPALYSLAKVLGQRGAHDEVAALFASYLETKPGDAGVRAQYMEALVNAGQYDAAIAEGQAILRKDPNSDAVYRNLSSLYLKQGRLEMAAIMGDKALALNDADPNIYNNMGVVHLQTDDVPAAIDKFQTARKLDSTHYEANMNLGLIALNAGDYALALECFDKALERNAASFDARMGKAVALRGSGDFQSAGKLYDELIKEDPSSDMAFFNAATLHERYTKDFTKALKYLEAYKDARAGQLGPNDAVFERIKRVEDAKAAEEERKRLEAERKKAEEERKRRARELLTSMKRRSWSCRAVSTTTPAASPKRSPWKVGMAIETAAEVVGAEDTEMATDVKSMLDDYYVPMLDTAIAESCASAAPVEEAEDDGMEDDGMEGDAAEGDAAEGEAAEEGEAADADATEGDAPEETATEDSAPDAETTEEPPADAE